MQIRLVSENLLLRAAFRSRSKPALSSLQPVAFEAGGQIWAPGKADGSIYFPLRGAISIQLAPAPGKLVEVTMVGREGFIGAGLEADVHPVSAVALSDGEALKMSAVDYRRALKVPAFRLAVEAYSRLYLTILSRMVVCGRVHVVEKLYVGRLLQLHDRLKGDSVRITQETFAQQMGVRRATVSRAVQGLQKSGAVEYDRRGRLIIVSRRDLERYACSCYHAVKSAFDEHAALHGGF